MRHIPLYKAINSVQIFSQKLISSTWRHGQESAELK